MVVQMFQPQSALRLAKEIDRIEQLIQKPKRTLITKNKNNTNELKPTEETKTPEKKEAMDPTLNLKDHPINVVLRKANEFINETF